MVLEFDLDQILKGSKSNAACSSRGEIISSLWPLSVRCMRNFVSRFLKLLASFCSQYLHSSPWIRPLKQLGGWADKGGDVEVEI
jgi:hypothetical protein